MRNKIVCALCGSKKTFLREEKVVDPLSLEVFNVCVCSTCFVGFTNPIPNNINKYYDQENYDSYQKKKSLYNTLYSTVQSLNNYYKIRIMKSFGVGSVLDYGAGSGSFVRYANKKGFSALGYEPINTQRGKNVTNKVEKIKKNKYKFITLWHVLEHSTDPKGLLSNIKRMLSEGGKIIVALPNLGSYDNIYYKNNWAGYDVPRHLYHFNKKSFHRLVSELNLKIIKTKPLYFDAYYVSMLSEKNRKNPLWVIFGFFIGFISNLCAFFTKKHSSIIYIIE